MSGYRVEPPATCPGCLLCSWLAYLATEPEVVDPAEVQVDAADLDAWAAEYPAGRR